MSNMQPKKLFIAAAAVAAAAAAPPPSVDGYEADVDTPVSSQTNNALRATPGNEMLPSSQQDMFATPTQEHALKVAAGAAASAQYDRLSDDNSGYVNDGTPSPAIDSKLGQTRKRKSVAGGEIKTPIKAPRTQKLAAPGSRSSGSSQGSQDSQRSSQGGQGGERRSSQPERVESNAETASGESDDIPCSQKYLQSVGTSTSAALVATPRYSLDNFEDELGGKLDVAGVNFRDVGGSLYSKKHRAAYKLARKRHVDDSSTFEFEWPDNRVSRVAYNKSRKQYCTTFLPVE